VGVVHIWNSAVSILIGLFVKLGVENALTRRLLEASACLVAVLWATSGLAAGEVLGRVAIIDLAVDTRGNLDDLRNAGVKVIGRYFGRCPQWGGKRIIDGGAANDPLSEISLILNDFAVLSIYQYHSNSKYKFEGKGFDADTGKTFVLKDASCKKPADPPHTAEQEATLDANAAVEQAKAVGQPPSTAIYFGIDFNFDKADTDTKRKLLSYFKIVSRVLKDAGYRVGAYGSGDALSFLKQQKPALIDFAWLSASRAFSGSTAFHNSGEWHLFQNWTDIKWFTKMRDGKCVKQTGLHLDTDIQNEEYAKDFIGFWNRDGPYKVPEDRTIAIYDQHRFACNGDALVRASGQLPPGELASTVRCGRSYVKCEPKLARAVVAQICFGHTVRIGGGNDTLVQIDYDDDGEYDGWTRISSLTRSFAAKPMYISDDAKRRRAVCPR
jgi:hypothetical protein